MTKSLALELGLDVTAGANGLFREISEHYPNDTDAAVVRATFSLCQERMLLFKKELAEDLALFWEAVAAIAEAETAGDGSGAQDTEVLARLSDLKERLFSLRLPAFINQEQWWILDQGTAQDYRKIVSAIAREAEGLVGDSRRAAEIEEIAGAIYRDEIGKEEAYALLGVAPTADRDEIGRLCVRLLDVWEGAGDEAVMRRREIQTARDALKQNMAGERSDSRYASAARSPSSSRSAASGYDL
jgi:hypothetical protein